MAVFRIERTRDYTVMSNHHLRNANLSLKAKGLLSMMLSLPEDWNYTTRGLAKICKEGVDAIIHEFFENKVSTLFIQHHTLRAVIGFQIAVLDNLPFMPPDFTILLVVPVNRILLVAFPPAGWQLYPFPVLVKVINLAAFGKPFPMFVHCPHSQQDMGVGIVSRRMGVMDGKISNHAFGNKLLFTKLPYKDSVLVRRYLSGDGKHPPPCKLGVPLFFHRFGGVP